MKKIVLLLTLPLMLLASDCLLPSFIDKLVLTRGIEHLKTLPDIRRNDRQMQGLCVQLIHIWEGQLDWKMLLVYNPKMPRGAFWFLPYDNENSAFDTAVYATKKYGGGFLSVVAGDKRYFHRQDPNRNFADASVKVCAKQLAPSPCYTQTLFDIIDTFRAPDKPYLALHNNTDGGGITVLKESRYVKSYLAYSRTQVQRGERLADEDSLVYIAGSSPTPPRQKIANLLKMGLNVKYEMVNRVNNDCSMSNYVVLRRGGEYYNIETEFGKRETQKQMVDHLMQRIR